MAISIGTGAFRPIVRADTFRPAQNTQPDPSQLFTERLAALAVRRVSARAEILRSDLLFLQGALERVKIGASPRAAQTISSSDIGLIAAATAARFSSSNEINTQTTRFSPTSPAWQGASQAAATIGGLYDGSQGTGDLTFTVTQGGARQLTETRIRVDDPLDGFIEEIVLDPSDSTDTDYSLSNGLLLQVGSGLLVLGDTFTVSVESGLDLTIDPNAAFDGSGGNGPEFDPGESVTSGSFTVNGSTISVANNDSVNSVLAKINASGANVNASYDAATELVSLVQNTAGSAQSISLSNDTSGFLSALKLDDGNLVAGAESEKDQPLQQVAALSGITAGSILINNTAIAVDPSTDSLQDLVDRIAASAAGVIANLNGSQKVYLRNEDIESPLVLDDNGTGFFAALNITPTTYDPRPGQDKPTQGAVNRVTEGLSQIARSYNRVFAELADEVALVPGLAELRRTAETAFSEALEVAGKTERNLGLNLKSALDESELQFSASDRNTFRGSLRNDFEDVRTVFIGREDLTEGGFIQRLISGVDRFLDGLNIDSSTGRLISTTA